MEKLTVDFIESLYVRHGLLPLYGDRFGQGEDGGWGADILGLLVVDRIGFKAALELDDADLPERIDESTGADFAHWAAFIDKLPYGYAYVGAMVLGWNWPWFGTSKQEEIPDGLTSEEAEAYLIGREASRKLIGSTPMDRVLKSVNELQEE